MRRQAGAVEHAFPQSGMLLAVKLYGGESRATRAIRRHRNVNRVEGCAPSFLTTKTMLMIEMPTDDALSASGHSSIT